jgi:hypothetical protein
MMSKRERPEVIARRLARHWARQDAEAVERLLRLSHQRPKARRGWRGGKRVLIPRNPFYTKTP